MATNFVAAKGNGVRVLLNEGPGTIITITISKLPWFPDILHGGAAIGIVQLVTMAGCAT
jgi:hypothetical protein